MVLMQLLGYCYYRRKGFEQDSKCLRRVRCTGFLQPHALLHKQFAALQVSEAALWVSSSVQSLCLYSCS